MELNRQSQLVITEQDEIHSERWSCPSCQSESYSSMLMEKVATKSNLSYIISQDSVGPSSVIFCSCKCGHKWAEYFSPSHHRPLIKGVFMINFKPYSK